MSNLTPKSGCIEGHDGEVGVVVVELRIGDDGSSVSGLVVKVVSGLGVVGSVVSELGVVGSVSEEEDGGTVDGGLV